MKYNINNYQTLKYPILGYFICFIINNMIYNYIYNISFIELIFQFLFIIPLFISFIFFFVYKLIEYKKVKGFIQTKDDYKLEKVKGKFD